MEKEILISSSSDPIEDVIQAVQATPQELESGAIPSVDEALARNEGLPSEEESAQDNANATHRRPKPSYQKRFDKLTARNYSLQEDNERLRVELRAARQGANFGPQEHSTPSAETSDQFHDSDPEGLYGGDSTSTSESSAAQPEYIPAHQVEQLAQQRAEAIAQQRVRELQFAEKVNGHIQRLEEAYARDPDLKARVEKTSNQPIRHDLSAAILQESNSDQIVLHLAQNPAVTQRLNNLEPGRGYMEIARLSARLERPAKSGLGSFGRSGPFVPAAGENGHYQPIRPVGNSYSSGKAPDEMDFQDFKSMRQQQEKAFRRRG